MSSPTTNASVNVIGLTSSFVLSGCYLASSQFVIPLLYPLPTSTAAKVFEGLYYRGIAVVAPLSVVSATSFGTLAYLTRNPDQRKFYIAAAISMLFPLVWTKTAMDSTIARLLAISNMSEGGAEIAKVSKKEVVDLLASWKWMNFVRSAVSLAGGLVGFYGMLS